MSGRNGQVSRIYAVLNLLEGTPQGLTVKDIRDRIADRHFKTAAKKVENAKDIERREKAEIRTVYRDLDALQDAGFPISKPSDGDSENEGTRFVLERTKQIGGYLILTPRELVGLYLAKQVLTPLKDTPFFADLNALFGKIEDKLGKNSLEHLNDVSQSFHFDPGPKWGLGVNSDVIDTVSAACAEEQVLRCTYASVSSDSKKIRTLGPHYLYFAKGSLYLVAEDMGSKSIKTFSVARMSEAKMLDEAYEGVKTNPEEFFKSSFGIFRGEEPVEVKISFKRETAQYVKERSWHPSQQIVCKEGGVIEVKLHVAITPELKQWVLGFGSQARVLSPVSLKEALVEEAGKLIKLYDKNLKVA